jgi:DNA/RNA-binding domain of Phe-tRNA-synthetase-like protein
MVSIKWSLSLGAHDLDAVALPIRLAIAPADMEFVGLGTYGHDVVKAGEFVYIDDAGRIVCRLDVVQAEFSKVRTGTSNVVVIVEGTSAHGQDTFGAARRELIELIEEYGCDDAVGSRG